jgi:hypothetical protein
VTAPGLSASIRLMGVCANFGAYSRVEGEVTAMRPGLSIGVGAVALVVGVVWTLQGLGYLKGSVMTGQTTWAVIGPLVAVAGLFLILRGRRGSRGPRA